MITKKTDKFNLKYLLICAIFIFICTVSVLALPPGYSDAWAENVGHITEDTTVLKLMNSSNSISVNIPVDVLPDGVTSVEFIATLIDDDHPAKAAAFQAVNDLGPDFIPVFLFDLNLLDQNGNKITRFNGYIEVTMPVMQGVNAVAYYDENTGEIELLHSEVKNGFITFKTNHFSYYLFIENTGTENDNIINVVDDEDTSNSVGNHIEKITEPIKENPHTGVYRVFTPVFDKKT